jgi:hypothetical protein
MCHLDVLAVQRLAIVESDRAPAIAHAFDSSGHETNHAALGAWLATAQAQGLIGTADPAVMATRFLTLLVTGSHRQKHRGLNPLSSTRKSARGALFPRSPWSDTR